MKKVFFLLFLLTILLSSSVYSDLDINQQGAVPDYISEYLSNGTSTSGIGDYSGKLMNFSIQPNATQVYRLSRMMVTIQDNGISDYGDYGALNALSNGITVHVKQNGIDQIISDGTEDKIKSNGDWLERQYDCDLKDSGAAPNNDYYVCRWTFAKSGTLLRLDGSTNDSFFVQLNDSFVGLNHHHFLVQGYIEPSSNPTTNVEEVNSKMIYFGILLIFFVSVLAVIFIIPFTKSLSTKTILILVALFLIMSLTRFMSWFMSINAPTQLNLIHALDIYYQFAVWGFRSFLFIAMIILVFIALNIIRNAGKKNKKELEGFEDLNGN